MSKERPLNEKVQEWLLRQGYPLEMKVARALQKYGFEVRQSHYYKDIHSNEHREIDILAMKTDLLGYAEIAFLIECKTSKKPWVLFTSENTISGYNRLFSLGITSDSIKQLLCEESSNHLYKLPLFKKNGRVAYGATVAFSNGYDMAFQAAMSSTKAAISRKKENQSADLQIAFPVIVVDGPMFESYLSNDNKMLLREISESYLFYHNHLEQEPATCVWVVKSDHLESFCSSAVEHSKLLLDIIEPVIKKNKKYA